MKKTFWLLAILIVCAGPAFADVTVNALADSATYQGFPDDNFNGSVNGLWTGTFDGFYDARTYLKFDLTSLPSISSATLGLYKEGDWDGTASLVTSYATDNSWTETGITYNNQPDLGTAGGSTTVNTQNGWYFWNVTNLAQASEGGIFSIALASGDLGQIYTDREAGINSPYLSVKTTCVPEPVSTTLFLLGGATLAVRRLRRK